MVSVKTRIKNIIDKIKTSVFYLESNIEKNVIGKEPRENKLMNGKTCKKY